MKNIKQEYIVNDEIRNNLLQSESITEYIQSNKRYIMLILYCISATLAIINLISIVNLLNIPESAIKFKDLLMIISFLIMIPSKLFSKLHIRPKRSEIYNFNFLSANVH